MHYMNTCTYVTHCVDGQVVIGDQMTCKNIRGAKQWRQSEICSINKFSWVKEVPGITVLTVYNKTLNMHNHVH